MNRRANGSCDPKALAFAAFVSLGLVFWGDAGTLEPSSPVAQSAALDGLVAASTARNAGAELLGDPTATARLGFAPEHDRLVWRVGTRDREVLIDAATGEALAFEFD